MRKKAFIYFGFLLGFYYAQAQDCKHFDDLMQRAKSFWGTGKFEQAINQLAAAREDCPAKSAVVDAQLVIFTTEIAQKYREAKENGETARLQTLEVQKQSQKSDSMSRMNRELALNTFVHDLVFKSRLALVNGDRSTAFRLAEFANNYVIKGDSNAMRAMSDALYIEEKYVLRRYPRQSIIEGATGNVDAIAISPDGIHLAIGTATGEIVIREIGSLRIVSKWKAHSAKINSITYSPTEPLLISMACDSMIRFWESNTGENKFSSKQTTSRLDAGIVSPDGMHLAFRNEGNLMIKKITTRKTIYSLDLPILSFNKIVFSPDGKFVYLNTSPTGQVLAIQIGNDNRNLISKSPFPCYDICFSPLDSSLALGYSSRIEIWNPNTKLKLRDIYGIKSANFITFCSDGKWFAVASSRSEIKICEYKAGYAVHTIKLQCPPISNLLYSPTGQYLVVQSQDNCLRIFNLWDGEESKIMELYESKLDSLKAVFAHDSLGSSSLQIQNIRKCTLFSEAWASSGPQSIITFNQLQEYDLENLLSLHPENESQLIATKEIWQIKAFADLAASQAVASNIHQIKQPNYERADRLYSAALALQDEDLIRMAYSKMLWQWAETYRSQNQEPKALELETKANSLWEKEKNR
jgi:tetratricopeptide (TPR) repeat protein